MIVFPNAKINLGLSITDKRADGYHNIGSCFYPIGWADALEVVRAAKLEFSSSGLSIPGEASDNLCLKAYHLLAQDFGLPAVAMHLHKIVPIGAGLGGGSSDAAFALKALNELFDLGCSPQKLQDYAAQIGSDCPFFIANRPIWASGRGEIFEDISLNISGKYIVLAYPSLHISTKEAYAGVRPFVPEQLGKIVLLQDFEQWRKHLVNDFERSLFPKYPLLADLKAQFYEAGALYAAMSGSGSTVFGIFDQKPQNLSFDEKIVIWEGVL